MRALHRIVVALLVGAVACATPVDESEIAQETKVKTCVLDANKWRCQPIWPVSSLSLGTVSYTEPQLRSILAKSIQGNGLVALAHQLIAAKLNFAIGASAPDFVSAIAAADAMIGSRVVPPVGTGFLPTSLTNALAAKLGAFNKCAKSAGPCVGPQADVAITKVADHMTPNVGDHVQFTLTVTDNGPVTATGVIVTDLVPPGLTFVSAVPSQGTYTPATGAWTVGTVPVGVPATLTIVTTVVSPNAQSNTATITHADQFDPNHANNSASVSLSPQNADLALAKSVNNATPNVGDTITFTITLINHGPGTATNVTAADLLPVGLTFVSANPSQGTYSSITGAWQVGTVTTATPQTLAIQATVVSPNPQTNTATITHADQFDPSVTNNAASATETPQQADLAITKTADHTAPNVGDQVQFTLTLTDNGPVTATNVIVADLVPPGLTFVSAVPSQGTYVAGTGVWTVGTVSVAVPATLTIVTTVVSTNPPSNTATITHADQFDPNPANNTATVSLSAQDADLALAKSVSNATPNVGDTITFTVTLTNNGPATATGVTVTDVVPAGLSFVSVTPSQGSYAPTTGAWIVGTVTTATTQTLTIQATVASAVPQTNTATITSSDQFDPNPANNTASATETAQIADLALSKSVSKTTPNVGDTITFTVTLSNNGPQAATGVTVSDVVPAGTTFVSALPSQGTYNSTTGAWQVGTLTTATTQTLAIRATVVSPNPQTNTATIASSDQFDPNTANNSASAAETPQQSDLAIALSLDNTTPAVASDINVTITVTNPGPDPATNVTVSDLLPAGLTFAAASPSVGSYNSATGIWSIGTLVAPATATLVLRATVVSATTFTDQALINQADQFDPNTANNTASVTFTSH